MVVAAPIAIEGNKTFRPRPILESGDFMSKCDLCLEHGCSTSHMDSSVKLTIFDKLAVEDIAKLLDGGIDENMSVKEMEQCLGIRLHILEPFAGQYVALNKIGEIIANDKSYARLVTGGKIRDNEVKLYHVPPRDRWGYKTISS